MWHFSPGGKTRWVEQSHASSSFPNFIPVSLPEQMTQQSIFGTHVCPIPFIPCLQNKQIKSWVSLILLWKHDFLHLYSFNHRDFSTKCIFFPLLCFLRKACSSELFPSLASWCGTSSWTSLSSANGIESLSRNKATSFRRYSTSSFSSSNALTADEKYWLRNLNTILHPRLTRVTNWWKFWANRLKFFASEKTSLHLWTTWQSILEKMETLVELAWTFYMFFDVASNFFNDFLNLLRKLQCVIISLLSSTFIKLLQRIIKVLAAISSREVLRVLSCISSNFKCIWDVHNFAAISMQFNFIHNVNSKLASSSASYLRSGG